MSFDFTTINFGFYWALMTSDAPPMFVISGVLVTYFKLNTTKMCIIFLPVITNALFAHIYHEYWTKDGGCNAERWECMWCECEPSPNPPIGECSLLGGVGIPAALWHTYHSLNLVCGWVSTKLEWGFIVKGGLDAIDWLEVWVFVFTGVGVSDEIGLISVGLDIDSSLLWQSSSES